MKLKYIIPSFIAVFAMLVGCNDKYEAAHLGALRVSSSYVPLSQDGGSNTFTVTASDDWKVVNANDWLTVSPTSGSAGETVVTLSASSVLSARTATIKLVSGSNVQEINIVQGKKVAELATCKQVAEGPDGKTFRVRASITQIANTKYGNMYIADETGSVYVYGTLDKEGKTANNPISSWGLEVGDVVTVEGPKKDYNGTIELVDVTIVKVEKWFVKMIDPETAPVLSKEGGVLNVKAAFKGKGIVPTIADDCTWIHYKNIAIIAGTPTAVEPNPADTAVVTFTVDANEGVTRKGIVNFMSSNGESSSSITWEIVQKGLSNPPSGDGTEANPYNVVAALDAAVAGATDVYVKGIVSKAPTSLNTKYNSLTYYISVDGKQEDELQVYSGKSFGGADFLAKEDIQLGDVVIVKGNLKMYKDAAEIDANNELVVLNAQTTMDGINDPGSYRNPFNAEAAAAYIEGGGTDNVFVKGVVSELVNGGFSTQYGNGSFFISDDGKKYGEPTKDFEAYQVFYLGNQKWVDGDDQIAVGDKVVIYGPLTKYKTTYETQGKGAAYIFSLNGKVK
jgi:hypothetical protein